jgi:hypothetical protein
MKSFKVNAVVFLFKKFWQKVGKEKLYFLLIGLLPLIVLSKFE